MNRLKKIIHDLLIIIGIKISRSNEFDKFLINLKVRKYVFPNTMLPKVRLLNFIKLIHYIIRNNINGDIVECGVWKGGAMALAALYLKETKNENYKLHLFDVFGDICEPDYTIDGERAIKEAGGIKNAQGRLKSSGIYKSIKIGFGNSLIVQDLISNKIGYSESNLKLHVGWFQETIPNCNEIKNISILRLDGDWYASTKICLDYLYDKLVEGGVIIIDDYNTYEGCKKAVDEFLKKRKLTVIINSIDTDSIFWIK